MNPLQDLLQQIQEQELWEQELELARNEYLKVSGSKDTRVYFVASGSLRAFVTDEEEEHTIRFAYSGDLVAALDSFVTEAPSPLYIQAIKKCSLKVLSKKAFLELVSASPQNMQHWQNLLLQLVYQQMEREQDLLTSSPQERYRRVLERSPRLFQEIPHRYIASYLRMTPETLSRIKKS
ncbi:Crp/Fnr family transcriptional regulator [Salinimicrobium soli]|uniref:Crp/Fnr family transcriptional regulator n=1 Tax=Salinimicrobium soli TaxID=1254399 RepID=UPI003AAFF258